MRAALAAVTLVVCASPALAGAKSFTLPRADVVVQIARDGALLVDENITFRFDGSFTGGFREVPLRRGESLDQVLVAEGDVHYRAGASAEIGSTGPPRTFGVARTDEGVRIVWHYRAVSEQRTFRVHYRLRGLAVAYDDVIDVNLKVWGEEGDEPLGRLTAAVVLPGSAAGPSFRAWGHPVSVRGDVTLARNRVLLRALDIPAGQFVELRTLFPRGLLSSTRGARVSGGRALDRIVAA